MSNEPDLTPEDEREITRLLAEAGGPVAAPPDVVARLDDVLAELVAARTAQAVDEVAEARDRRRRWPQVLLAASAVAVGGYALGAVTSLGPLGGSDGDRAVSGSAGSEPPAGAEDDPVTELLKERARPPSLAEKDSAKSVPGATAHRGYTDDLVRLRSDRLETGVRRVLLRAEVAGTSLSPLHPAEDSRCGPPEAMSRNDSWFHVRLDGRRAVLVTGPERDELVEATVYSCGGNMLAEASVPAP